MELALVLLSGIKRVVNLPALPPSLSLSPNPIASLAQGIMDGGERGGGVDKADEACHSL